MPTPFNVDADIQKLIRGAALQGRLYTAAFTAGTGNLSTTPPGGLSLFNAATARTFIVISARAFNATASKTHSLRTTTSDPALGSSVTPQNNLLGAAAPASLATVSLAATGVGSPGTYKRQISVSSNGGILQGEFMPKESDFMVLPAGQNTGLIIIINGTSGDTVDAEFVWAEVSY